MYSEKANDMWLFEGAPQRVWIVSWPGASRRATRAIGRDSVCLTPDAAGRKTVRSALLLSARTHGNTASATRAGRGLPPGYTQLDDIDGIDRDDQTDTDDQASVGGDDEDARGRACDHMIDLKDSITSASFIRMWCATMAPGETFTFGWRWGGAPCEGIGRVECRAAFGKRHEGHTLGSGGGNSSLGPVTVVTYIVLAAVIFCFLRMLFCRRT